MSEFSLSENTVRSTIYKYRHSKNSIPKAGSIECGEIDSVFETKEHFVNATRRSIQPKRKFRIKSEPEGIEVDEWVELFIDHYIPCFLLLTSEPSDKILIYFHANAEDIGQSLPFCHELQDELKCHILVVEYEGYSVYKGIPSQESIFKDCTHIFEFLNSVMKFKSKDIYVLGRSIGSGPAVHLASTHNCGGLCLISPFTSIKEIARYKFGNLASSFLKERFNNKLKIKLVKCPVYFVHGKSDQIVPHSHTKELYGKNFFELDLCESQAEYLIFRDMTHSYFDSTECVSKPFVSFLDKTGRKFRAFSGNVEICLPLYLFLVPKSVIEFLEVLKL